MKAVAHSVTRICLVEHLITVYKRPLSLFSLHRFLLNKLLTKLSSIYFEWGRNARLLNADLVMISLERKPQCRKMDRFLKPGGMLFEVSRSMISKKRGVCDRHFRPDDFFQTNVVKTGAERKNKRLKPNVVPSVLWPDYPAYFADTSESEPRSRAASSHARHETEVKIMDQLEIKLMEEDMISGYDDLVGKVFSETRVDGFSSTLFFNMVSIKSNQIYFYKLLRTVLNIFLVFFTVECEIGRKWKNDLKTISRFILRWFSSG